MNASLLIVAVLCKAAVGTAITWSFEGGGPDEVGGFTGFFTYDDEMLRTSFRSQALTYLDGHTKLASESVYTGFASISITGDVIGHIEASSESATIVIQDDIGPGDESFLSIPFLSSSVFVHYWWFTSGAPGIEAHAIESSDLK